MQIDVLNNTYFTFKFSRFEMQEQNTKDFMQAIKDNISGKKHGRGTLRWYLANRRAWCIHRGRWNVFAILVRKYFGYVPKYPFTQTELRYEPGTLE